MFEKEDLGKILLEDVSASAASAHPLSSNLSKIGLSKKKVDFLSVPTCSRPRIKVADLISIANYYLAQGIKIYIDIQGTTIPEIQSTLQTDEYAGYVYTNNVGINDSIHTEVFIIGKNEVLKPIVWNVYPEIEYNHKGQHSTDLIDFCSPDTQPPRPQATDYGCGSLGMSYLKNYLRNNAQQLKEFTLRVPYYHPNLPEQGMLKYFLFPSPHVLRYSQVSLYNKFLEAMLQPGIKTKQIIHKDSVHQVVSIEGLLHETIKWSQAQGNQTVNSQSQAVLDLLPFFRDKWLSHYHIVKEKRALMQTLQFNKYLDYTVQRMHRIAESTKQKKENPGLNLLQQLKSELLAHASPCSRVLFLSTEVSNVVFKSFADLGYFLSQIDDIELYPVLLAHINLQVKSCNDFDKLHWLLQPVQWQKLYQCLQEPKLLGQIVSNFQAESFLNFFASLVRKLDLPKRDLILFLEASLTKDWLNSKLKKSFLKGYLSDESQYWHKFSRSTSFSHFLQEHLDMSWVASKVPRLIQKSRLYLLLPLFKEVTLLQDFIKGIPNSGIETSIYAGAFMSEDPWDFMLFMIKEPTDISAASLKPLSVLQANSQTFFLEPLANAAANPQGENVNENPEGHAQGIEAHSRHLTAVNVDNKLS